MANGRNAGRLYVASRTLRKAVVALAAIMLVGAVSGCRSRAEPTTASATAVATPVQTIAATQSATVVATATKPAGEPAPTPARSPLDASLDQIERRVEEVRGLRPEGETGRRFVDAAALAEAINEELDKPDVQEQIGREQRLYRLLGMIGPNDDLDRLYRGLLGSQVLGLYDPDTEEFLVLQTGDELTALAESTYAHEYAHRLQDVRFDLDRLTDDAGDNSDRQIALAALIEGDATVTQLGYGVRFMSRARLTELLRAPEQFEPPPAETPFVLIQGLEFPYTAGPLFVAAIRGNAAGFEAVDQALLNPPTTSEQVLHPDKYRSGENAAPAALPDLTSALGDGWTAVQDDVLGEFLLKTWLSFLGRADAAVAVAGWGGDAYQALEGPDGQSALGARIVWDRPEEDAEEFFESLVAGLDRSPAMRRAGVSDPARVIWEGGGRAIGVRLGRGGEGTFLAAATGTDQVKTLLDRLFEGR